MGEVISRRCFTSCSLYLQHWQPLLITIDWAADLGTNPASTDVQGKIPQSFSRRKLGSLNDDISFIAFPDLMCLLPALQSACGNGPSHPVLSFCSPKKNKGEKSYKNVCQYKSVRRYKKWWIITKKKKFIWVCFAWQSVNITRWMICQGSPFVSHIHLKLQHCGICLSQCLIRMAWSEHPHSEKGAQQLLLQLCYPW